MSNPNAICKNCQQLIRRFSQEADFSFAIASNFQTLEASSAEGCGICRLIRQRLVYGTRANIDTLRTSHGEIYLTATLEYVLVSSPLTDDDATVLWPRLDIYLAGKTNYNSSKSDINEINTESTDFINPNLINCLKNDAGLNTVVSIARRWISTCLSKHPACCLPFGATSISTSHERIVPPLPTRVIDVGVGSGPPKPKLLVPDGLHAEYFALSYSWGMGMFLARMTQENLEQMKQGIDMGTLPQTIQDAIIFTQRTQLARYLWVDALCIIQTKGSNTSGDDEAHHRDWITESQKFGEYYHNALCTLAATGTSCSTQGLFLHRPAEDYPTVPLHLQRFNPSGSLRWMTIEPSLPSWWDCIIYAPLFYRGWTMQERAMSMRILHFTRDAVLWECNETKASEFNREGLHEDDQSTMMLGADLMSLRTLIQCVQEKRNKSEWLELATSYSLCQFTFFSDRMTALSGLAQRMQKLTNERYVAGFWEGSIQYALAWYIEGMPKNLPEGAKSGKTYIAPSWSWASVPFASTVRFLFYYCAGDEWRDFNTESDWRFPLEIVHVHVESSGTENTGPVHSGRIRVRGLLTYVDFDDIGWDTWQDEGHPNYIGLSWKNTEVLRPPIGLYLDTFLENERSKLLMVPCLLASIEDESDGSSYSPKAGAIALRATRRECAGVLEYSRIGFIVLPRKFFDDVGAEVVDLV